MESLAIGVGSRTSIAPSASREISDIVFDLVCYRVSDADPLTPLIGRMAYMIVSESTFCLQSRGANGGLD